MTLKGVSEIFKAVSRFFIGFLAQRSWMGVPGVVRKFLGVSWDFEGVFIEGNVVSTEGNVVYYRELQSRFNAL